MNAVYALENGIQIELDLKENVLDERHLPRMVCGYLLDEFGRKSPFPDIDVELLKDERGLYFIINGRKIYIKDFVALDVDNIIEQINSKKEITETAFLSALLKNTDEIAFECTLTRIDNCLKEKVICIPSERHSPKEEWDIVVCLIPLSEKKQNEYCSLYTLIYDIIYNIKKGNVKVVKRRDYENIKPEENMQLVYK